MSLFRGTPTRTVLERILALSVVFSLLLGDVSTVYAQVSLFSKQVNYQAKLMSASGVAVPDGTYNLWFRLYLTPSGATTSEPTPVAVPGVRPAPAAPALPRRAVSVKVTE